ncbi:MAG: serine/threonine protein kinase [Oscillospiraceae bacterium]|nr:serine/threonine protein kinase [Oscillospiraceae bacterium]
MTQIGSVIDGKYEILTEIGRGGMSVVYLAMDKRLNKQWAVKEVRKKGVSKNDEIVVNSLMAEANLIKRLDHPAFPRIVDIIDNGQTIYIVMDYIEGESLDKIIEEHGAQSEENVIRWAMQICDALNYLHSQKPHPIIYRDMKPANLMLKPEGEYGIIKIIDFGIAREFKDKNLADTTVLGTRGYASPEHYAGHTDVRSDIFSLGMTMHHLLTGIDPRKGGQYASVRNWNPELSEGIEIIVDKCVQPAPENRYQNCDELLRDLYDPSKLTRDYRKKEKRKLGAFLCVLALSIVMLIGGIVMKNASDRINSNNYETLIGVADSTPYATKVEGYKQAINIYPEDLRGYTRLLDAYADNGKFSATESGEFLSLYNKYSDRFDSDSAEMCELRYKIGTMYFNYYTEADGSESDGARAKQAYHYFEENYNSTADYEHKTISDCFYWVCYFYNNFLLSSNTGRLNNDEADKGDYEMLFKEINSRIGSIQEEGPYNKLSLYSVVFNTLYMERKNMAQQGISQTQVLSLFDNVYQRAMALSPNKEQAKALQNRMRENYENDREMIETAFTTQERSGSDNG